MDKKKIGLVFIGKGEIVPGVPARNLTPEEASKYEEKIARTEESVGRKLYRKPTTKKKKPEAKDGK